MTKVIQLLYTTEMLRYVHSRDIKRMFIAMFFIIAPNGKALDVIQDYN